MTKPYTTPPDEHGRNAARVDRLERIANRMDNAFRLPGTNFRVGWDAILSIVPGVGDTLALAPAAYIYYAAWKMGMPRPMMTRMAMNTGVDYVVGSIPLVGTIFDAGFKSNLRNVDLLKAEIANRDAAIGATAPVVETPPPPPPDTGRSPSGTGSGPGRP